MSTDYVSGDLDCFAVLAVAPTLDADPLVLVASGVVAPEPLVRRLLAHAERQADFVPGNPGVAGVHDGLPLLERHGVKLARRLGDAVCDALLRGCEFVHASMVLDARAFVKGY